MLAALLIAAALQATPVRQPPGPFCLVAAGAMALEAAGRPVAQHELARDVRMYEDGTSYLELQRAALRRGVEALVFHARDAAEVERLVRAGAPVVLGLLEPGGKHAVVLLGIDEGRWRIVDPRVGEEQRVPAEQLRPAWVAGGRQAMAFIPADPGAKAFLEGVQVDADSILARDRRYRAEAWRLEAAKLPPADSRREALLARAAAAERGDKEQP